MEPHRVFGRRAPPQPPIPRMATPGPIHRAEPIMHTLPPESELPSVEDEIEAWKSTRRPIMSFPWRQVSLMAGICFGTASFVLPDTVNAAVQWPLYALAAISLYAGLHKRKAKSG